MSAGAVTQDPGTRDPRPQDPPSLLVARQVVGSLLAGGVREAVLCPGSRNAPLALALAQAADADRLRLRVVLDERSAGFIAVGIARAHALDGWWAPAAVVTTSGTAVPNLHPAACEADAAGVPLLLVCADRPHELVGTGANQTTRQATLFGDAVRAVVDLPADLPAGLGREAALAAVAGQVRRGAAAAAGALSRDPGPVLVNVRLRPPLAPGGQWPPRGQGAPPDRDAAPHAPEDPARPGDAPWPRTPPVAQDVGRGTAPDGGAPGGCPPGTPPDESAGQPPALLARADGTPGRCGEAAPPAAPRAPGGARGIVVAGDSPHPGTGQLARALAEHLGWPLLAEPTSQARGGACALTRYAELLATEAGQALAGQAQHVVVTGHPTLSRPVTALLGRRDVEVTVLAERARWTDVAGSADAVVVTDPFQGAGQRDRVVAACGLAPAGQGWLRSWHQAVGSLPPLDPCAADEVVSAVWEASSRPGAPRLVVGSSLTVRRLDRLAPAASRGGPPLAVANRGLAGIDGTVATALGLAVGSGGPVRAVMGDLTFLHDAMSLARGRGEAEPDLQVLVLDDAGGMIFHGLEHAAVVRQDYLERLLAAPQAVDIPALARAAGARVHCPADLAGVRRLLEEPVRGLSVVVVQLAATSQGRPEASISSASVKGWVK